MMVISPWLKKIIPALTTLFLIWATGFLLFLIAVSFVHAPPDGDKTDAIIVLTGGQNRINTGLDLLAGGQAGYLFISGVNRNVTIEELVKLWNKDADYIPCCIFLGHAAHDTEGNARESSEFIRREHIISIRLVTSNYHLPRAWLEFSHALPRRKIILHPITPTSVDDDSKHFLQLAFAEYNKTILTWARLYLYPWDRLFHAQDT